MHDIWPGSELYEPTGQGRHMVGEEAAVTPLKVPGGQLMQTAGDVPPTVELYVPTGQETPELTDTEPVALL
jgi:hypothetical protein